ncbi:outer membrane beta-barrel protein [Runella sp. CRIBMP]|nr:outer membrane beta-barrel protein [Runella sp. CRIBMP]
MKNYLKNEPKIWIFIKISQSLYRKTKPLNTHLKQNNIMKKFNLLVLCLFATFLAFPKGNAGGKTDGKKEESKSETKVETKTEGEEEKKGTFTFSGYIDSYYIGNFNKPASRSNLGAYYARAFDQKSGQFSLGLVQTKMQYSNDKSDVVVDLAFGPNADLGNYGNVLGALGSNTNTALAIKQAYFNWKASSKFTLTAGQFGTHIGYEVIDAPVNFNYSLSNLFNNGPFYHIGVKANYAFSDKVSLMLGLVNNVDNLNDNNRKKGLISQLFINPAKGWNVYLNFINSNEASPDDNGNTPDAHYRVLDLTTSYQATDKLLVGLNAAYGSQKGDYQGAGGPTTAQTWGGAAGYFNVAASDIFSIGARYEYFDNSSGVRALLNKKGEGTSVNSLTLTGNFTLADGHLLIKPEFRLDAYKKVSGTSEAKNQQFEDENGDFTKSSQSTLGLAFIYKF